MSAITQFRRRTILLCGGIVVLITLFAPPGARADEEPCVDPYVDQCFSTQAVCVDCERFCETEFPPGECEVEWDYCEEDEVECYPAIPVLNECTCKEAGPG